MTRLGILSLILTLSFFGCAWLRPTGTAKPPVTGVWFVKYKPYKAFLKFSRNGTFEVDLDGNGTKDIWGRFEYFGSHRYLKFIDASEECGSLCRYGGFYDYSIIDGELSFNPFADECPPRLRSLSHRWQKKNQKSKIKACIDCGAK